jgi:vacuolar protein sorting-associated protein 3
VDLLQSGLSYDVQTTLTRIELQHSLLLAELVILYGRLLRHDEALRLLVHGLRDFQGGETYCYSGGSFVEVRTSMERHEMVQRELFPRLLGEYLRLEDPDDRVTQTVNLLDRWGRFFDVTMVINPDFPPLFVCFG